MAVLLVIGPIFEVDLLPRQYGFRPGLDAKMAVRRVYFSIAERGAREVVDTDLADYFNTIPHGDLLRCVRRRIADGRVLSVIRQWLDVAVVERTETGERRTTEARDRNRGVPQGAPVSPPYKCRFLHIPPAGTAKGGLAGVMGTAGQGSGQPWPTGNG
jgi:retron-type reverse transcriptase